MKKMKKSRASRIVAQIDDDPTEFMGVATETLEGLFERHDQFRRLAAVLFFSVTGSGGH
jgi:hypothetical protein